MAQRPLYLVNLNSPYYRKYTVDFEWYAGLSISQKRKSVNSLHRAYLSMSGNDNKRLLEISSVSEDELGVKLSAFNLKLFVPGLNKKVPVECLFQGGKVFENGGPYTDLYEKSPKEAKKDERLYSSGKLISFEYEGKRFPLKPETIFYDYLYMSALKENEELSQQILEYDGFSDIVFNPNRSINTQAKAAAEYVSLVKTGQLDDFMDKIEMVEIKNE